MLDRRGNIDLEQLQAAVESAGEAVVITNADAKITYVNPAFERITGWSRDEVIGQNPRVLKNDQTPAGVYEKLWQTISQGNTWRGSFLNQRKDGTPYRVEQTIAPVMDSGRITAYVSVHRDITERDRLESELRAVTEEKLRLAEQQLATAREIQQRLYPQQAPTVPGLEVAGATFPAEATCGDYFDFITLPEDRLGLVVGDVSGHGLGPAMLMVETRASLRALCQSCGKIDDIVSNLNALLVRDTVDRWFVTLFFGCIDFRTQTLQYVGAGHGGYLIRRDGRCEFLGSTGLPLGLMEEVAFPQSTPVRLESGDCLLLVTDGLVETHSPSGEMFGSDRMLRIMGQNTSVSAEEIVRRLYRATRDFAGDVPQSDDMTIIIARRN